MASVPGSVDSILSRDGRKMIMETKTDMPAVYLTRINVPGYLPESDDLDVFDTAQEAWRSLADTRKQEEDDTDYAPGTDTGEYSDTWVNLDYIASADHQHGNPHEDIPTRADGSGCVYGGTPGYAGDHDLGYAYSVVRLDHRGYPHYPGYLVDCEACEAKCHCVSGAAECVFEGEHYL